MSLPSEPRGRVKQALQVGWALGLWGSGALYDRFSPPGSLLCLLKVPLVARKCWEMGVLITETLLGGDGALLLGQTPPGSA